MQTAQCFLKDISWQWERWIQDNSDTEAEKGVKRLMLASRWQMMKVWNKTVSGQIEKGSLALGRWLDQVSRREEKDEGNRSYSSFSSHRIYLYATISLVFQICCCSYTCLCLQLFWFLLHICSHFPSSGLVFCNSALIFFPPCTF